MQFNNLALCRTQRRLENIPERYGLFWALITKELQIKEKSSKAWGREEGTETFKASCLVHMRAHMRAAICRGIIRELSTSTENITNFYHSN